MNKQLEVALSDPVGAAIALGGLWTMGAGTLWIGAALANPWTAPATMVWLGCASGVVKAMNNMKEDE